MIHFIFGNLFDLKTLNDNLNLNLICFLFSSIFVCGGQAKTPKYKSK